jgi:alpha-mannosidase/mannosylglycerate hydrolase
MQNKSSAILQSSRRGRKPTPAARKVHYVLSTHWDREWYQSFQDYRRRLVRLMDRVLDDTASGKLRGPFVTDGQSIVLEDYLEICPERRGQITEYAKSGQLKVGPWYVMPDEWLVSGESIVRNIRLGREVARNFGATPSDAGFVCDTFGHIGQLPQIFRGFGIRGAFLWRGIEPRKNAHFRWQASDGSEVICLRFGRTGYCDYTYDVRHSTEHGYTFDGQKAVEDLNEFLARESARVAIPPMLLLDGGDHLEYDDNHYRTLFGQKTSGEFPYQVEHSSLDAYLEEVLSHEDQITDVVRGELRESAAPSIDKDCHWLIPGVLSSRVWIKQQNAECQTLLCQWAEPLSAFVAVRLGVEHPDQYLQTAWRWLLQNHPHDSICGCSIDEVHEDMKYRFAQCRQIALGQTNESLQMIALAVEGELAANETRVVVANPLTTALDENIELTLDIPAEWGTYQEFFGFEPKPGFRIFDTATGKEIPYQLLSLTPARIRKRIWRTKYPEAYKVTEARVALKLSLPATGYATLTVREGEKTPKTGVFAETMLPTRHPALPGLATSDCSMENEFLSVRIEANGSLTVTDKRTKETYSRLLTFEDVADIGDGWYHGMAVNDQQATSTAAASEVLLQHDGPQQCTFRIRTHLRVPGAFDTESRRRSATFTELLCDSRVTLRAGAERIEVTTSVDNTVRDHRLRVLFPTGAKAKTFLSDSAFDVVEREITLPKNNHTRRELAVETTAQQTWSAVSDAKRGLAIVAKGLPECAVRDLPERPVALTLFRSTQRTVFTDGQPGGQLLGPLTFEYWIVPFKGEAPRTELCQLGQQLGAGLRDAQIQPRHFMAAPRNCARIALRGGLLEVSGGAVVTSVRQVGAATEVRLFNPNDRAISVKFNQPKGIPGKLPWKKAQPVNLESQPIGKPLSLSGAIPLKTKQIVTVSFG